MIRRLFVLVSVLTLVLPSTVFAEDPSVADRFPSSPSRGIVDPAVLPAAIDDSRSVTVMVQLEGDPVAVVQAESNRKLTRAERDAIKAQLKARQDAITDDIAAQGGEVESQLQSAYNGIRVRVSRRDAAALASLPGVIGVRGLQVQTIDNATSVPFLGVPAVWQSTGFTGENIIVGIIDTGLDYTHANFGGPGTAAAYDAADALDITIGDAGDAGLFGPDAPKVKGGFDFSGDTYDASSDDPAINTPKPDPDPLDCQGHGSHVGGTTGGFGVLADGTTYGDDEGETYDESTHLNEFKVGPGVAPNVDLYALRVFGCDGSTDLTVNAIDWAVDNELDVINMSLGSPFGRATDPSAVASTNAAAAGVIVVASAGNSGANPYITGAPGAGDGAISVAAVDSSATFPAAILGLSTGASVTAINANAADLPAGPLPIHVLRNPDGTVSLGCNGIGAGGAPLPGSTPGEYAAQNVAGKIVVTVRGGCARVARAVHAQQAGAAGAIMIDTSPGFPPFEGEITGNPDIPGHEYLVTIPFLGVRGVLGPNPTEDGDLVVAADGGTTTLTATTLTNPGFRGFASFSSGGPRNGDSAAKPNIAAPGVSTLSTDVGTGTGGTRMSGTSMASPHVAGVAALVRESHPDWSVEDVSAAIQNYADPSAVAGYRLTRAGTGLVDTAESVAADVVALGDGVTAEDAEGNPVGFMTASLSYGFAELGANFSGTRTLTVRNHGDADVTLNLGSEPSPQSRPASLAFGAAALTVPAGGESAVEVTLNVPVASVGGSFSTNQFAFREASGNVTLSSGELVLRVPYLLVPRALSNVETALDGPLTTSGANRKQTATVTNEGGTLTTAADVYAWGLEDPDDMNEGALGGGGYDVRAVGVQSFDAEEALGDRAFRNDRLLVFAINNWSRWSTAAVNEWDINVDSNGDGSPDYIVVAIDSGAIRTGSFNGLLEVFFVDLATGDLFASGFLASSPTDSSTLLLPVLASDLGLSNSARQFSYSAVSFSLEGPGVDVVTGSAGFNAFKPAITTGQFVIVQPNGTGSFAVEVDNGEWKKTPAKGLMVVALDNAAGAPEAQLIPVPAP